MLRLEKKVDNGFHLHLMRVSWVCVAVVLNRLSKHLAWLRCALYIVWKWKCNEFFLWYMWSENDAVGKMLRHLFSCVLCFFQFAVIWQTCICICNTGIYRSNGTLKVGLRKNQWLECQCSLTLILSSFSFFSCSLYISDICKAVFSMLLALHKNDLLALFISGGSVLEFGMTSLSLQELGFWTSDWFVIHLHYRLHNC